MHAAQEVEAGAAAAVPGGQFTHTPAGPGYWPARGQALTARICRAVEEAAPIVHVPVDADAPTAMHTCNLESYVAAVRVVSASAMVAVGAGAKAVAAAHVPTIELQVAPWTVHGTTCAV